MSKNEVTLSTFNSKYTFWATLITIFILFPIAILLIKTLDIKYTVNQTQLIIAVLSIVFGFLIIVMKSTMQKISFIKSENNFYLKDDKGNEVHLPDNTTYNIYNYNSRKAFMLRVTTQSGTRYFLSPDMNMKPNIEVFFGQFLKKASSKDFYVKAFPIVICFAYVIISIVLVLYV
ncbi:MULTISPECIES: hypothetical protein [unclassified Chryseobacterium]|uniref:hypothetical protein n=1 Tax=unclassified Chryseobacterium TaxID=2593645 RepID=UPI00100ACFAF|nr:MULTISPECIES: hypothetical protein [unclassified Chryseobacterium]RXM50187.1 hypothetical protein BOQ64_18960 [Chryseobacterium sp. CH25]RXM62621.1 hypothetical protein BOQ60_21260 [Chryseobacterium sp. CH1]